MPGGDIIAKQFRGDIIAELPQLLALFLTLSQQLCQYLRAKSDPRLSLERTTWTDQLRARLDQPGRALFC